MKKLLLALAVTLTFTTSATAAPIYFGAALSGANEVPANASPGTGFVWVAIDDVAHTLTIDVVFSGLVGNSSVAHIHCCAGPGANAGVATPTPSFPGFPAGVQSGSYSAVFNTALAASFNAAFVAANGGTPAGAEARLFAEMILGRTYFNLHSSFAPGGELRGNLAPIPEPATMTLVLAGLGAAALRRRRKAQR